MTPNEFVEVYQLGFAAGVDVGYGRAQYEQTAEFLSRAEAAPVAGGQSLSWAELEQLRAKTPEQTTCTCPTCWLRRTAVITGGGDYPGRAASRAVA